MKIAKKHLQCLFCSHKTSTAIKHFLALCRCCTVFPLSTLAQFLALTKPLPLHILTSTAISLSLSLFLSPFPLEEFSAKSQADCQNVSQHPKLTSFSDQPKLQLILLPPPPLYPAPPITILLYEARGFDIKLYFMCKLFKFVRKFCKIGTLGDERCI